MMDLGLIVGAFFVGGTSVGTLAWIAGASLGFQKGLEAGRAEPDLVDDIRAKVRERLSRAAWGGR